MVSKGEGRRRSERREEELERAKEQIKKLIVVRIKGGSCQVDFRDVLNRKLPSCLPQGQGLIDYLSEISEEKVRGMDYEVRVLGKLLGQPSPNSPTSEIVGVLLEVKNTRFKDFQLQPEK